jgi:hypothetical protein
MRSANQPTFVRHIDGAAYGDGQQRIMDEDDALEQAEAEIRRLKGLLATGFDLVLTAYQHGQMFHKWQNQASAFLKEGKV